MRCALTGILFLSAAAYAIGPGFYVSTRGASWQVDRTAVISLGRTE